MSALVYSVHFAYNIQMGIDFAFLQVKALLTELTSNSVWCFGDEFLGNFWVVEQQEGFFAASLVPWTWVRYGLDHFELGNRAKGLEVQRQSVDAERIGDVANDQEFLVDQ